MRLTDFILFKHGSLEYKFLVLPFIPVIIATTIISLGILTNLKQALIEKEKQRATRLTDLTVLTLSNEFVIYNKTVLDTVLDNLTRNPNVVCAVISDTSDNRILSHSHHRWDGKLMTDTTKAHIDELARYERGFTLSGDLIIHGKEFGVLTIVFSLDEVYEEISQTRLHFFIIAAAAIILGAVASYLLAKLISNPIKALAEQAKVIGAGNFEKTIVYNAKDALGQLVVSFNQMVENLKTKQQQIMESESRLRVVIETIPELVWLKDPDGKFLLCNPQFEYLYGAKEADIIGKTDYDFVDEELATFFRKKDQEAIAADGPNVNEEEVTYATNGQKAFLETIKTPMYDTDGKLIGILGIARDISERKAFEEQLRQAGKMETMGKLAGGIAHDFNNILSPILGYTEILLIDCEKDPMLHNSLSEIYSAACRAKELVTQILTFSRREQADVKPIALQPIVNEALRLIRSTIPATIEIKKDITSFSDLVFADATQIHQIIMNLATNAYHAMEESGGTLSVILKEITIAHSDPLTLKLEPGSYAYLEISDTGTGMDTELINQIFEPFFTTKKRGKGTGMGLSVVHGIIKAMKGNISVESLPGKGTTFSIHLPLVKTTEEKETLDNASKQNQAFQIEDPQRDNGVITPKGSEQILIVDDEKELLNLLTDVLKRLGYGVASFSDSVKALEAFRTAPDGFDLVVTDMAMPNLTGDGLATEILKIRPEIPILLCTGYSATMTRERAISLGIREMLTKPVNIHPFTRKIRTLLDEQTRPRPL